VAGRIRAEDIETVRERTDIAKVVGEFLTLKKAGHDSLVGLCPFHSEKTPSFSISPSKQVYYCFGCGAGGDAVRFLQEIENLTFVETIERLARMTGTQLRYEGDSPAERKAASQRQALFRANEEAAALYRQMLADGREGSEARAYLEERGIGQEVAERFQIGYAPGSPDFLMRRLAKRLSPDLLVEAGLVAKDGEGGMRDRFRGRITFPIRDLSGRHVGFGGRILPSSDAKVAKYVNTSETPIYRKSELLYNLDGAKSAATRSGELFVTEGYTDVVAMAQGGVEAAVATCGTAITEQHLRLLSRFAQRAILTFDADEAGARAAERAYAFHENAAVELVVLILPKGLDPAEFVRQRGGEEFREFAAGATPLVEYMIRRVVERADTASIEGRTRGVDAALPIVGGLKDPVRRQQYAHLLAELTDVSDESLMAKLGASAGGAPAPAVSGSSSGHTRRPTTGRRAPVQERVEREMLKLLARDSEVLQRFGDQLMAEHFESEGNRALFGKLVAAGGDVRSLAADSADERTAKAVSQLTVEPLEGEPSLDYAEGVWLRLEELLLQRKSGDVRRRLQKLNPVTDLGYDELFQELISIDAELRRLREGVPAGPA